MKQILALTLALCLSIFGLIAQDRNPILTFEKTSHDFGSFPESLGSVTATFKFTNTGNAPLLITRSAASCGCTVPEYPKEPIAPGKGGEIKVTYNAQGRPGNFMKTVWIFTNSTADQRTKLAIKGNVLGKNTSATGVNYRAEIGDLYVKSRYLPMLDVRIGDVKTENILVYNPTDKAMSISFTNVPEYVTLKAVPEVLKAGEEGRIEVTFDAEKSADWGLHKCMFNILVNKKAYDNNQIVISADIKEKYKALTNEEYAKAPVVGVENKYLTFEDATSTSQKVVEIVNKGKSDLLIRKVSSSNDAFTAKVKSNKIRPGKEAEIEITFDPSLAKAKVAKAMVYIVTNDPRSQTTVIDVRASVK